MKIISIRLLASIALLCLTISACEQPASQPDALELRAEIEQLENQVGRLEFRIFELEQALGENKTTPETANSTADEPAAAGRYDLTPVE